MRATVCVTAVAILSLVAPHATTEVKFCSVAAQSRVEAPDRESSNDYVLGAGDQISLTVVDMPEVSQTSLRIDPGGDIDLPLIGEVHAAGLTLGQLRSALTAKLGKYITDPEITINVTDNQSRTVSVLGEVNSPGVRELTGPRTLIQVITAAGGVKTDAGPRVIVTREMRNGTLPDVGIDHKVSGNFSTVTISLDDLLASKRPADNFLIQPGDIVSIPKEEIVYVVGDVHRAGGFPLSSHNSISLLQALSLAEGLGPDAALARARILRPVPGNDGTPKEIPVDLKAIVAGKAPDLRLFANDILFIPNSSAKSGVRRAAEAVLQVATGVAIYR